MKRAVVAPRTSLALLAVTLVAAMGCSAVVSPDVNRLGRSDTGVSIDSAATDGAAGFDAASPDVDAGIGSCGALLVDCNGTCADLARDPDHCGACDLRCEPGVACSGGTCGGCAGGDPSCGGLGDPTSCGASRAVCDRDQLCVGGACVCRPPLSRASGVCVDLASDPDNCGAPGRTCASACAFGACVRDCPTGTSDCDGACVSLRSDPLNCGDCGRTCGAFEACQDGECRGVSFAAGCSTCPCEACGGRRCCLLARYDVPYCLDADRCP